MKNNICILLLLLCSSNRLFAQQQDSAALKRKAVTLFDLQTKVNNYHASLNMEPDVKEKLILYNQFTKLTDAAIQGMISNIAVTYAKANQVDSSALWMDKVSAQKKAGLLVLCAKAFSEAQNANQAIKLYQQSLELYKKTNNPESLSAMATTFYDYLTVVPIKGNEQAQHLYLKYLYESGDNSFSTDLGYYWGKAAFDANKLLFYNYAQTLVYHGEVKAAAQVVVGAFQTGVVPDTMLSSVENSFAHVPEFSNYLKAFKVAGKTTFQKDLGHLMEKRDVNGKVWGKSAFKGKYLLLDFWGSWCLPCRYSHPHLKDIYSKYKHKGLEILGVGYEKSNNLDVARADFKKAIAEDKLEWLQYLNQEEADKFDVVKSFGIAIFPTKILIDPSGKELARFKGGKNDMDQKLKELFGF